jgi:hypothetical protein
MWRLGEARVIAPVRESDDFPDEFSLTRDQHSIPLADRT